LGALWRRRRGDAAASAVIAAFFTLMFAQEIFGGKYVLAGDPLYYTYPLRSVGWEMLRGGQLPLWTPLVLSGYPLLSMSQLAFAYPLTWGYLFLPGHWAEQVYVLAPFLLAPLFTYAYAREVRRSRTAAVLAGLSFGYGGMMCSALAFNGALTNSLMWLPLLLIPIDRAARRAGRFVPLLIAATAAYAMSVLNGHGQSMLYTGLLAAAYGLYLSLFSPVGDGGSSGEDGGALEATSRTGGRRGVAAAIFDLSRWRPLCVALGALVMSAGIGAFQILETMRAARRSVRSVLTYESFSTGSFSLAKALGSVVAPLYHFTDVTAYMPPLALLLAALTCVISVRRRRRRETADARIYFWFGVAVVAWFLMLGSNTPLHQIAYHTPLLNKFRVPSRHTFEWTFALAILAAYGWDALDAWLGERRQSSGGRRLAVESAAIVLLIAGGVVTGFYWWTAAQAKPQVGTIAYTSLPESTFLLWKAAFTACTLLLLWRSRRLAAGRVREGLLMAAIALVCFVEPAIGFSRWIGDLLLTAERFSVVSPTTRFLQNFPPEQNRVYTRVQLYAEEFTLAPRIDVTNLSALRGIQNVAGYEPLILERYSRALGGVGMDAVTPRAGYMRNSDLFQSRSRVLDLLNTTHVVSFSGLAPVEETMVYREGIAFAQTDTLSALPPRGSITLTGGAEESDSLALVTSLSNSVDLAQGTPVARVRFRFSDERSGESDPHVIERDIRAGIDTAEWAHERPDVRPAIKHALAPIFEARPGDERDSFKAYRYLARLPLGARGRIDKIEITNLTERAYLALSKATLYDSAGKSATPLSPAASEDWETVYLKDDALILKNRRALPRAWLVTSAEAVDGEEALRRIRGESEREFDPRRTALLEVAPSELPALRGGELGEGSGARVTEYEPNRLVVETQAAEPTVLVVSENIYPGWEATVDGKAARIDTANYLLRGVALPAGAHRVEMRYTAPAARNGAVISVLTLLLLCGLMLYDRRARRRPVTNGATWAEKYLSRFGDSLKRHAASMTGTNGSLRRLLRTFERRPVLREVAIFLAFVALSGLMTWPWLRHPLDTVSDLGDPYTIAYTLWWDYHQTFRDPLHLFDASIFYPYRDTLAFTEHDYGIALLFFPLFALGVRPLTVHSLATVLAFVLSGYGAFRLMRTLTGSYGAAWVAGVAFAFIPYRFQRLPHLHYIFAGWIPLLFEALILFARARSWRRASWLGVAFLMNALTCITWFILSLIPLGLSAAVLAFRYGAWRDRSWWLRGATTLAAASLVVLPFLLPYRRVAALHQFTRDASEVKFYSATALNWLAASPRLKLWQGLGGVSATEEMSLFPGLVLPLLAFAALVLFDMRRDRKHNEPNGDGQTSAEPDGNEQASDRQNSDGQASDEPKDDERGYRPDGWRARWKRFASPSRLALLFLDLFAVGAGIIALLISGYGTINFGMFGLHLVTATRPEGAFVACLAAVVARAAFTFRPLLRRAGAKNFNADDAGRSVETFALGAIWLAVGFVGSLGMHAFFHKFLYEHFEVFKSQRVPARWAMICYVGLALLAGLGARALARRFAAPHQSLRQAGVYALVIIVLLFDLRVAPLVVKRGAAQPDELTLRLKATPMRGGLVELPVTGWAAFYYMIRAADHEKPIVTATSSFLPPIMRRIESLSQQRPVPAELLDLLESVPASYLVIHYPYMTPEDVAATEPLLRHGLETGRLRFIRSYHDRGRRDLYAITKTEPAAAGEAPAPPELVAPAAAVGAEAAK
jgi:hypothetical protein